MALQLDIDISFESDSEFEYVVDSSPPAKKRKEAILLPEAGMYYMHPYCMRYETVKF